jgi:threonine/homoserine/homoserine lactone efflux protein
MSMSNAVHFGLKNSYPFNLGCFAGFFTVMLMCTIFSSTLFNYIPQVKIYMLAIGASYMLYLAWKIFKSSFEIKLDKPGKTSFISGLLFQFVNPKLYIYAITVMSVYILPVFNSKMILAGFSFLLALVGITSTLVWALFGEAFHRLLHNNSRVVNTIMSLLLVYCAVSLFL